MPSGRSQNQGGNAPSDILKYPLDLDGATNEYTHRINFTIYKQSPMHGNSDVIASIHLYMPPDALKTSYQQSYADADVGAIGNAILRGGQDSRAAFDQMMSKDDSTWDAVKSAFSAGSSLAEGGAIMEAAKQAAAQATKQKVAGAALGGATAVQALEATAGRIINPHKAVMYGGPGGFRIFNYTFTMMPRSKAEADEIAKIVWSFKYYMHPGLGGENANSRSNSANSGDGATINTSHTLTFPEEFGIDLRVNKSDPGTTGSNVKPLFKIDRCFLESLNVDYATQGSLAFFEDGGQPQTTTLALQFKETSIMTKRSIMEGF